MIVDSDAGDNRRKLVAFVGGLDLCDGRYDNPQHSLFRTLQSIHKDDYHNPTFAVLLFRPHDFSDIASFIAALMLFIRYVHNPQRERGYFSFWT